MYRIKSWQPNRENQMGGSGFAILLTPKWKEAVRHSNITQEYVDNFIKSVVCRTLLRQHGFSYNGVSIQWGQWGIEHITVNGNACGLDINYQGIGLSADEAILEPHNVDTIFQASLLLSIFLWFAENLEFVRPLKQFIRFKDLPPTGISGVYDGDLGKIRDESGICVFDCIKVDDTYRVILPSFSTGGLHDLIRFIDYDTVPVYLVEGRQIGTGTYGEPTISDAKIISQLELVELHNPKPKFKLDRTNVQLKIKSNGSNS